MQKIANCLKNDNALGDKFQTQQAIFLADFKRLDDAMLVSRKSLLTPEIQALDEKRIQEWRMVRSIARESKKLPNKAASNAAEFVLSLIANHGDIETMKVTERTGSLSNLCQDLTETYASQSAAIDLTEFAAKLSGTNAEYLRLYEERLHQWADYTTEEVQNARRAIEESLENLCIMVASGIINDGYEPYKHYVEYVNEAIKVAKIAMNKPTSKPEGAAPGEGEEETDPTNPPTTDPTNPPTTDPTNPPTTDPDENENDQTGGEQGGEQQQPGGSTNTPSGPNTDAWGDGDEGDGSDV